jgi:hypothetical protein
MFPVDIVEILASSGYVQSQFQANACMFAAQTDVVISHVTPKRQQLEQGHAYHTSSWGDGRIRNPNGPCVWTS